MKPLNAKINRIQLEPSNRFSARAEVVVPDKIVFVELFNLPSGVQATNLSDVAPGTHELLLHGDGAAYYHYPTDYRVYGVDVQSWWISIKPKGNVSA